ncbi:FUSC family protein [Oceanisphaera pacifica]|uniref:FUSC family protein n=1 Tax=Oceanisphaera pacifica TaxID=2818389 RepID=A0ABS3NH47_9GAMM|nr:FUSC family protein [Oceanisphaera pacifica]MBO1519914.1 FUSC family protein [Oceanisphaera pacifica]
MSSSKAIHLWCSGIKQDLRPYPGRWPQTWRIAVLCALMTLVSMAFQIPAAMLSCYVIFFVMKSDAAESTLMATALVVLVSIVVLLLVGLINLTIGSPPARLAVMAVSSVGLLFLGVTSGLGPLGGIIALVVAFVMTLLVHVPVGELATRALLYAWLMVAAPMALVISFNLLLGRPPQRVLADEVAQRLELAADSLEQQAGQTALWQALAEGIAAQQKRLQWLELLHLVSKPKQRALSLAVVQSYQLLLSCLKLSSPALMPDTKLSEQELAQRAQLAQTCRVAAQQLRSQFSCFAPHQAPSPEHFMPGVLQGIAQTLQVLQATPATENFIIPREKTPFFVKDVFTNPSYQRTALKTTAAAILCYLIYSAIEWEGIHTALVTCYVACLGSSGETVNKLMLRIIGCLIGATLGVILLVFFMPHMTSIVSLMVAVLLVSTLAAWISLGSERVAYTGLQIAFAFLLISLQGFGPDVDLSVAGDRIVGILLGNLMMYLAFTQIWPYSILHQVNEGLSDLEQTLSQWQQTIEPMSQVVLAARATTELEELKYQINMANFESKKLQTNGLNLAQSQQRLAALMRRVERQALGLTDPS